ncbi:hypothetical protein [Microbulbifer aggregans]|uniref:hypothetical protein n=1 Tax=Microbulbifer aggregans TaxID=1769779 RepID=UPI001CFECF41|nr:hypothetical protein [Microbulbifer aggregans]
MVGKVELVEILLGAMCEDPHYLELRNMAAQRKIALWLKEEWVWVKDLEVTLKKIKSEIGESEEVQKVVVDLLFNSNACLMQSDKNELNSLVGEAKKALGELSNPV